MEGVACRRGPVPSRGADARENRSRRAIGDVSAHYESFTAFWFSADMNWSGRTRVCGPMRRPRAWDDRTMTESGE
jgi:hypothetical protein